jgi:RNA 3'-terminal phosphate cyclase
MITNQKIEVEDVEYSRFSRKLRVSLAANSEAIHIIEDICGKNNLSIEEIADEMAKLLESAMSTAYHRGGMRIKYD